MNKEIPIEPYKRNEVEQKSLDLFHEGQALAASGEIESALVKIEESLVLARDNNDPDWVVYLEATVAYLTGDLETLKALVDKAVANKIILERLVKGLEARGTVDYKEDYYK